MSTRWNSVIFNKKNKDFLPGLANFNPTAAKVIITCLIIVIT